jgi:hypothetical protein
MKLPDLKLLLTATAQAHIDCKVTRRIAINIWGQTAAGKSQMIYEVATDLHVPTIDIRVGQMQPEDLIGLPYKEQKDGVWTTHFALPAYLPQYAMNEDGSIKLRRDGKKMINFEALKGFIDNYKELEVYYADKGGVNEAPGFILFFDEINRIAGDESKNALFQLPEKYQLHGFRCPDGGFICSATNPNTNDYQVGENFEDKAFLSRFCHVSSEPDAKVWLGWAEGKGAIHHDITSYIDAYNASLFKEAKWDMPKIEANQRTWEMMNVMFYQVELPKEHHIQFEVAAGLVGDSYATAFLKHVKEHLTRPVSGEEVVNDYGKHRKRILAAAKKNDMSVLNQTNNSLETFLSNKDNQEKVDWKIGGTAIKNIELYLLDLPIEIRTSFVASIVLDKSVSKILGPSDVIFDTLSGDKLRATNSK